MAKVDVAEVKRRLDPRLDEPYFQTVEQGCNHVQHGVRLDIHMRTVTCKGCGATVDPFTALVNYSKAERRLVAHAQTIERARKAEQDRKDREKLRRPLARTVKASSPTIETRDGEDIVMGHVLLLECGHSTTRDRVKVPRKVTCHQCGVTNGKS